MSKYGARYVADLKRDHAAELARLRWQRDVLIAALDLVDCGILAAAATRLRQSWDEGYTYPHPQAKAMAHHLDALSGR